MGAAAAATAARAAVAADAATAAAAALGCLVSLCSSVHALSVQSSSEAGRWEEQESARWPQEAHKDSNGEQIKVST